MENLREILSNNIVQSLIFFVLGTIVSYFFFKLSVSGAKLTYQTDNTVLIDKENQLLPEDMELHYKNQNIDRLIRTNIRLWNSGNKTIRENDLNDDDILRIEFDKSVKVFSAKIVTNTDESNGFRIIQEENKIMIHFKYFEPKNGVKLEVIHDIESVPKFKGKVIDVWDGVMHSRKSISSKLTICIDCIEVASIYLKSFLVGLGIFILIYPIYEYIFKADWISIIAVLGLVITPAIVSPCLLRKHNKSKQFPLKLE